jgi:hypothetical protein
MRRAAYILTLAAIWAASMAALILGLDGLEHPPFVPHALLAGAYFGAISSVSLAEEISEWRAARRKLPPIKKARRACCLPSERVMVFEPWYPRRAPLTR